jgi:hypothetical protein
MIISVKWLTKVSAILIGFLIFWHNIDGTIAFSTDNQAAVQGIKLKFGTPVLLQFVTEVSSESCKVSQVIDMEVSANVYKNGVIVIPKGLPAKGMMISGSHKNYAGEGGNLAIGNFYVIVNGSQRIDLDGIMRLEGEDRKESLVIGQCCPLGYLIRGKEACINKGQTFRTVLSKDEIIIPPDQFPKK